MTRSGRYDRDAAIEALLSEARRETLALAVASCAIDDDAAAIAQARLRWAISSVRPLIMAGDGAEADHTRHAHQLDRIANRAQRWLVEPARSLREIGRLVGRRSARATQPGQPGAPSPFARQGQPARPLPVIDAGGAALVDLDLDALELTRISLRGATLAEVSLRRADCTAADASASRWQRCELARAELAMAVLAGAHLQDCDLTRAQLAGTSWHRAGLVRCALRRATLIDARLDLAVFTDCDLRGADLAIARSPHVATLVGARFVRCDLRDTSWRGRELGGATLIDCKLHGARGGPRLAGAVIERADLSPLGDGSQIGTHSAAVAAWSPA